MRQVVCTDCLTETFLQDHASENDISECDYCDRELPVMDMEELILPSNRGHSFKHSSGPRRLAG